MISSSALVIPAKDDSQCDHTWCYSDIVVIWNIVTYYNTLDEKIHVLMDARDKNLFHLFIKLYSCPASGKVEK